MGHSGESTRGPGGSQGSRRRRPVWPAPLLAVVLCLAALPALAAFDGARYSRDAERLFARGVAAYERGDLEAARDSFRAIGEQPANQRSGAALLMLSRTLLRQGEASDMPAESASAYGAALDTARRLQRAAPDSRYAADAGLLAGDAYHQLKRYYEAATEYARLLDETTPIAVRASAAERLAAIVRNRSITPGALDGIRVRVGEARLQDALLFGEARWYGRLGWTPQSRDRYRAYVDSLGPGGMFHALAQAAQSRPAGQSTDPAPTPVTPPPPTESTRWTPEQGREDVPRIGVLAPLTGDTWESAIGRDLVAGARMANEEMGEPFDLVVFDTGAEYVDFEGERLRIQSEASRMLRVVSGARFLVNEVGVTAIVGPVFSTSAAAAAGVVEAAGVPLIAPLAQQSGLDTIGTHVFQLNPIPEVQGRSLAEYATLVLGLRNLAILSPMTDYGYALEQAFTSTAVSNGGRIVHSDWYVVGATDFQAQFDSLRIKGFRLQPQAGQDSLALYDSLETALLDTSVVGAWVFEELVRAEGLDANAVRPDSSDLFIDAIDGVAVIVEQFEDAARIAPQLRFHRLSTMMLGNDIWNDPEALAQLPQTERIHLQEAVFVSRRQGSSQEQDFIDRYRLRTHRDDAGYAAAGYDAVRLILAAWDAGQHTRATLRDYLADVRQFDGASGRISFTDTRRANSELTLLTIDRAGRIRALTADDLPSLEPPLMAGDLPAESAPDGGDAPAGSWELSESGTQP